MFPLCKLHCLHWPKTILGCLLYPIWLVVLPLSTKMEGANKVLLYARLMHICKLKNERPVLVINTCYIVRSMSQYTVMLKNSHLCQICQLSHIMHESHAFGVFLTLTRLEEVFSRILPFYIHYQKSHPSN